MRPFLKWAGNKYLLNELIVSKLPSAKRLLEPFTGSGSVFLNSAYPKYLLGETNHDLVNLYEYLKKEQEHFIDYCKQFFQSQYNQSEHYYRLRDEFNRSPDPRFRAAVFVYLNKHGFHGLCRYNNKGVFNVPYGFYKTVFFPFDALYAFAKKLKRNAELIQGDFKKTLTKAKVGDAVYCDPPYVPLTNTANFTAYAQGGFCEKQHEDLAKIAGQLANRGIPVLISNHDTPWIRDLYRDAEIFAFRVKRSIGVQVSDKEGAPEILALFE